MMNSAITNPGPSGLLDLFPFRIDTPAGFLAAAQLLKAQIAAGQTIVNLGRECRSTFARQPKVPFTLVLLAKSPAELLREVEFLEQTWEKSWASGGDWKTPAGSCFSARPLASQGKLAFVYPGLGSVYLGFAADLFDVFPDIQSHLPEATRSRVESLLHRDLLYPRDVDSWTEPAAAAFERRLYADPLALAEIGVVLSYIYTALLRRILKVSPACAFGNSLGEVAMFACLDTWQSPETLVDRLRGSDLYRTRLHGPMNAVREAWSLPPPSSGDATPIWASQLIKAPVEAVKKAIEQEPRAYLTHINTPDEVILSGEPFALKRSAQRLDVPPLTLPFQLAVHCAAIAAEAPRLEAMYTLETAHRPDVDFYSHPPFTRVPHASLAVARTISETLCQTVNFPQLAETAYAQGARLFLEVGPRQGCTSWIDVILAGRPHLAVSVDKKGTDVRTALLQTCARLLSHGVEVDPAPFFKQ